MSIAAVEESTALALVPQHQQQQMGMVMPLVSVQQAAEAIGAYEALKTAIVRSEDIFLYDGKKFLKKSFWRRVATCFGLTVDLVNENRGFDEKGKLYYSVLYRAIAPNGRTMIGDGYCSTAEKGHDWWPEHNVRATAHTRAKNRAISDLVGGGEVSADELVDYSEDEKPAAQRSMPEKRSYATLPPVRTVEAASAPVTDTVAQSWLDLQKRAATLDINTMDFAKAKKTYKTIADMAAALNRVEEQQHQSTPQEPEELDLGEVETPAPILTEEQHLERMHQKAVKLGYTVAQWEALVDSCHRDLGIIAQALEQDLSHLKTKGGVH